MSYLYRNIQNMRKAINQRLSLTNHYAKELVIRHHYLSILICMECTLPQRLQTTFLSNLAHSLLGERSITLIVNGLTTHTESMFLFWMGIRITDFPLLDKAKQRRKSFSYVVYWPMDSLTDCFYISVISVTLRDFIIKIRLLEVSIV